MSIHLEAPTEVARPRLNTVSTLVRFALIGIALAAVAGTFAYLGGWFSPNDLTPARFTNGFEEVNGVHPGFRRNHAKGVGVSGFFESNGNGARLSKAVVFQPGRVPVIGRFSLGGGQPYAADLPKAVRGLGLQFSLPDGELWRTAMINFPVFPVRTPEAFYEQLLASKPDPKTGKPDQAKMDAFLARHPESDRALKLLNKRAISSGFENSTFHGLNAFWFSNAAGDSIPVRWLVEPIDAPSGTAAAEDKNYLFDALIAAIHKQPLRWRLLIIIGQPGDPTNDATVPWPAGREQVNVGTLTLDHIESNDTSPAAGLNFDPLVLPAGIAPSNDPLLSALGRLLTVVYSACRRDQAAWRDHARRGPERRVSMSTQRVQFTAFARLLHWTMAAMILTMLCIGVAMVVSLANYHVLVSIHRPLGIAILVLAVVRFVNRQLTSLPPFPATMSRTERLAASATELTMYGLMVVLPLVGWGMLSAARYPIVLFGSVHLPFILPHDLMLYAVLRKAHTILAYLFFLTILAHFGAILFHTLIVRDGMLKRMAPWTSRPPKENADLSSAFRPASKAETLH